MSVMDLSSVMLSLASGTYTVTRRGASSYDSDGILQTASTSTLSATGSMQPIGGRDLQRLPEGMRSREGRSFWTPTQLLTAGAGQEPDTLAADGDTWEVENVESWGPNGAYCKAIILKVGS